MTETINDLSIREQIEYQAWDAGTTVKRFLDTISIERSESCQRFDNAVKALRDELEDFNRVCNLYRNDHE